MMRARRLSINGEEKARRVLWHVMRGYVRLG